MKDQPIVFAGKWKCWDFKAWIMAWTKYTWNKHKQKVEVDLWKYFLSARK